LRAQASADRQAIFARHHHIQHDQIELPTFIAASIATASAAEVARMPFFSRYFTNASRISR